MGVEMKSFIAIASMLLFVFAVQGFGFAFGAEQATANDSINASQMKETLKNVTLINVTLENVTLINVTLENVTFINVTLENVTFINGTLESATLINGTLESATLINGTLKNATLTQNDSNPFANAKNRQPKRH